jgi:hypothetical protein
MSTQNVASPNTVAGGPDGLQSSVDDDDPDEEANLTLPSSFDNARTYDDVQTRPKYATSRAAKVIRKFD